MSSSSTSNGRQGSASSYPSINIVGAGIAGLSLACHLRWRRIPFAIFDAASKPKGHNYGVSVSSWGYSDVLPAIEPKLHVQAFRELTAVDRLTKGSGVTTSTEKNGDNLRASDMALREVLAGGHHINWDHKVVSAERVSGGLKIGFENGKDSTANLVVDAGGERSGLTSLLLPDLKPDILPYAVYHGSRYIPHSTFTENHSDIFHDGENVRNFPPPASPAPAWHLQLAKSYIIRSQVPSAVKLDSGDDLIVEFRYTFSRPSQPRHDPLYNPSRAPAEAKTTPSAFFDELSTYLSSSSSSSSFSSYSSATLPPSLHTLLAPATIQSNNDRILNWLLRIKPLATGPAAPFLHTLAEHSVISLGDAVHSTPPVGSEGASLAMADAGRLAAWVEDTFGSGAAVVEEGVVRKFYEQRRSDWVDSLERAKEKLREMHNQDRDGTGRLSGRI